ncbi:MAG: DUF4340 domain-containing protein [Planctomycetota bacterium]
MSKLNLFLCVLIGLQAAWLASEKFLKGDDYRPKMTVEGDLLFPDADPAQIARLIVNRSSGQTELRREGDRWVVFSENNKPADENLIQSAVSALSKLKPGNIVSENPAKHADFEVVGEKAIEVTAVTSGGSEVVHFILGKTTPNWRGAYVRYPVDSDDVMLVETNIRSTFDRDGGKPGAWRDKKIFDADVKLIRGLEVVKPGETVRIERKLTESTEAGKEGELSATDQDDWNVVEPVAGKMSRYSANSLASTIAKLRADAFVEGGKPAAELGLDPAEAKVTARLETGEPLVFEIGKEVESKRYVRVPGNDDVYQIASYRLLDLLKDGKDLVEKDENADAADEAVEGPEDAPPVVEEPESPEGGQAEPAPTPEGAGGEPPVMEEPKQEEPKKEEPKQEEPKQGGGG